MKNIEAYKARNEIEREFEKHCETCFKMWSVKCRRCGPETAVKCLLDFQYAETEAPYIADCAFSKNVCMDGNTVTTVCTNKDVKAANGFFHNDMVCLRNQGKTCCGYS